MEKDLTDIIKIIRDQLSYIKDKYKVQSLELFGSYIRDEQHSDSDLDLLVTYSEIPDLIKLIELENYLSEIVDLKVDLVMKESIKPQLYKYILKETVPI